MTDRLKYTKKQNIDNGILAAETLIVDGNDSALEAYLNAMANIDFLTGYTSALKKSAMEEMGGDKYEIHGRTITKCESGVKYVFKNCGYPKLTGINSKINNLLIMQKEAEATLKSLKEKTSFFDEETGEVYEALPPMKISTTTIKINYNN